MKAIHQFLGSVIFVAIASGSSFARSQDAKVPLNLIASAADITNTMKSYVYDRSVLDTAAYKNTEQAVLQLAQQAKTQPEFIEGFNKIWRNGPFSHVHLGLAQQSAEQMTDYFDSMNAGGKGAILSWQGDIAVLTVNTMMGNDTIAQIDAAYQAIAERQAKALIIDLRENEGGSFAVKPLLSHLVTSGLDAGFFLSQRWTSAHKGTPSAAILSALAPWQGWSVRTFWHDVQSNAVTRIRIEPSLPHFAGPVFALTSKRTASAAELATDALLVSGRAIVIGEQTAGEMLSQKLYDLPQGLQLSLPIADYYGKHSGRIEGHGVKPAILTTASDAMTRALALVLGAK